jgi:hypothetical protein
MTLRSAAFIFRGQRGWRKGPPPDNLKELEKQLRDRANRE